VLIAVN